MLVAEHDLDRTVAENHAAVAVEGVRALTVFKDTLDVPAGHDVLVVKELLKQLVKRHLKHLGGHFGLVDDELLALVAEAEHVDRVLVVLSEWALLCLLIGRLLTVLDLHIAAAVVVVVCVQKSDLLAVFVLAQVKSLRGQSLDHLIERDVTFFIVEPDKLFLWLGAHLLDLAPD